MRNRLKILIAEDDLSVLGKIYFHLLHNGYHLEATNKTEEIKQRVDRFKPKLLIMSATIKELTHELLLYLERKHVPVLYLMPPKNVFSLFEVNEAETIKKPIEINILDNKIRELLHIST